jgi:diaminopimelate decarboxylase
VELARQVRRSLGLKVTTIDIGGGFPVSYREEMQAIGAIGTVVDDVLGSDHGFRVLAEPGRIHSVDVIARSYPMPPLAVGDIVVSPLMGAHTAVTSSRFNGITETPVVVSGR